MPSSDTQFRPGDGRPRPGRPRGAAGLARLIRERCGENLEQLVDATLAIATNPQARNSDRLAALAILFDRSLGKPHASSSVAVTAAAISLPAGWESMSNSERLGWADNLRSRALAGATVGLLDVGDDEQ